MNEIDTMGIKDKVSICALAYNHVNYLDDFFKGVLNQNVPGYRQEIIIGVDTCNDGTLEKCIEYKNEFPGKIKLIIHAERAGMIQNWIEVVSKADGEYIAFCECDDYWIDENKLAQQISLLLENKEADICFTDLKILKSEEGTFKKNWATITKKQYSLEDILKENVISTCTVVMRNTVDRNILDHLVNFEVADWPFWILSMYKNRSHAIYLDSITTIYRHHDGGFHSTKNTIQRLTITNNVYHALLKILKDQKLKKIITRQLTKNFYSMGVFQNDKVAAKNNYVLSMRKFSIFNIKYPLFSSFRLLQSVFLK